MATDAAPVISASTSRVAEPDRFPYFCDAIRDVYLGIRPVRTTSLAFGADVLAYPLDGLVLSRMRAPGHQARRDRASLASAADDAFFLNVAPTVTSHLEHVDGHTLLRAGRPALLDNARPFTLTLDPERTFRLYSLRIPYSALGGPVAARDIADANQAFELTPSGRRTGSQARLMCQEFDAGRLDIAAAMAAALVAQLRAHLHRDGEPGDAAPAAIDTFAATALLHLDDPAFGLRQLAHAAGRSPRTVQAAFAAAGTSWSEWALDVRLSTARERLESAEWSRSSVERIARASGFRDVSHFHRRFRARFGDTPGAFRPA